MPAPPPRRIVQALLGTPKGGRLPAGLLGSQGSMSKYTPTMREKIAGLLAKNLYGDSREGYRKAERLVNVGETVVPPLGLMTGMYDAGRAAGGGNMMQAGLIGGMAALPLPPAVKKGIRAYHGSPHSFDKFSMDKIGTGEGAQAYGHGLYFAEGEGVAKSYRDTLTKSGTEGAQRRLKAANGDIEKAIADAQKRAAMYRSGGADSYASAIEEDLRFLEKYKQTGEWTPGHMYEVNIDADPEQFLDWDKPLSEQPESIKKAYESYLTTPAARRADKSLGGAIARKEGQFANPTGKDFYGAVYEATPSIGTTERAKVTKTLQQAGIPGIKYFDQGSRGTSGGQLVGVERAADGYRAKIKVANRGGVGFSSPTDTFTTSMPFKTEAEARKWAEDKIGSGSRNYVVFDEKLISIVRKYGIAGASTLLGYDLLSNVTTDQAEKLKQAERVY